MCGDTRTEQMQRTGSEQDSVRRVERTEPLSGDRTLVMLEDGTGFPLYRKELDEFAVCEGRPLAPRMQEKIFRELLPKRARLCAMNYLQHMDRTEQQLRRKLQECCYPEEIAEQAVEYVRGYHYIDDVRYAVNYMTSHAEGKSLCRMEQELGRRGVSRESFQEALQQMEPPDEEGQIYRLLEKRHYSGAEADRSETERTIRFLLRRGYSMSAIQHVLLDIASKTV